MRYHQLTLVRGTTAEWSTTPLSTRIHSRRDLLLNTETGELKIGDRVHAWAELDTFLQVAVVNLRVRAAATGNVTIAQLVGGYVLDGVTLATGDDVLLPHQVQPAQNGIYRVGPTPVRPSGYDTFGELGSQLVEVLEGTTYGGKHFRNTSGDVGSIGMNPITYQRVGINVLSAHALDQLAANPEIDEATGSEMFPCIDTDGVLKWMTGNTMKNYMQS